MTPRFRPVLARAALAASLLACSGGGGPGPTPSPGTLRFTAADYPVAEGAGTVTLTAERTGGSAGAVSVSYATGGDSAAGGADFTDGSGALSWGDGDAAPKTLTIAIVDDATVEGEERFYVEIHDPTGGASLGTPTIAAVTIADDDGPPAGVFQLGAPSQLVDEGAGTATITVRRTGGSEGAATVAYATGGGTAAAGDDYAPTSGTLSWADGDAADKTFTVPILDDTLPEIYESLIVTLGSPTGGAALGSPFEATLVIRNDDAEISLSAASAGTSENGEPVVLQVVKAGTTPFAVTVRCATGGGTATAGQDYVAIDVTLSWPQGEGASRTFVVDPADDAVREGDETVLVTLSSPTGGAVLGSPSTAEITIGDDEPPVEGFVAFSQGLVFAANYGGGITVTVERSGGDVGPASVAYATLPSSSATEDDYVATSGTLSWADGESGPKTFAVEILDDLEVEVPHPWILLELSSATGAELGPQRTSQVTILENWTKSPHLPLLSPGASAWDSAEVRSPSVVQRGPAEYVMYYQGVDGSSAARIGRALSPDGVAWTRDPDGPVLDPGGSGAFDASGVRQPSVVFDGTTWHMWYAAGVTPVGGTFGVTGSRIGYATSSDGVAWTRQNGGGPVLSGEAGEWDRDGVAMPAVLHEGDSFEMWYVGAFGDSIAIGRATSADGVTWTRDASNPVLTGGPVTAFDADGPFEPTVLKDGTTYRMWYEGLSSLVSRIGYARSFDGTSWTKYPGNAVIRLGSYLSWDEDFVGEPSAVKSGESFQIWYRGSGFEYPFAIGRATLP